MIKLFYLWCFIFIFSGYIVMAQDNSQKKISVADSLTNLLQQPQPDTVKVFLYLQLARELRITTEKQIYLEKALAKAKEIQFAKGIAMTYNLQGIIARDSSKYPLAIDFFTKSIEIAEKLPEKVLLAEVLGTLGSVYRRLDDYEKSLHLYLKSLQVAEACQDEINYSRALNGVGNNYRQLKNYPEAIKYFEKALTNAKKRKSKLGISVNINNLGKVYYDLGNYDKAMPMMQEALKMNQELNNQRGMTSCLNTIGDIYHKKKEYSKALATFKQALEIDEKLGDRRYLIDSYINFGELYAEIENYQLGINYINKALQLALDINTKSKVQSAYEHLYLIYKRSGDYQKALVMHEKAQLYKDSILNDKNQESVARMQAVFDTEKNEATIQLLEKDNKVKETESRRRNNLMSAVVIFLVVIAVIFYVNFLGKKKANEVLQEQNITIQQQSEVIAKINQDWQSSVNYAKRIQMSMLPHHAQISHFLPEYFIYFRPKDIVSGDFYWFYQIDEQKALIACVDCTGHGVPGAFMSMLANALLSKIVENKGENSPEIILNQLHIEIVNSLNQETTENRDGMEMTICLIDKTKKQVSFAGAVNPLLYIQNGELHEIKGDKLPIGGMQLDEIRNYTLHQIPITPETLFYTFTDGYKDQFGGDKDKKFMIKRMRSMFVENSHKAMAEQEKVVIQTMDTWMQKVNSQIDDMLVLGFKGF
jgi:tetratricopeptide (TPR) repeat protein